jgi:tetratricopeptide (TPR) repeat protein
METVLPFFEQRIKNGDATIIQVQYELASEAQRHSEWDRASGLYEQALVNHSKPDIKSSLDITQYQSGLAMVRRKQQRYEEAAELYHEILSTRRKSVEAPHELLLGPQALLADTLCWLGKFSEAASLILEALEWQEHLPDASCFDRLPLQLILARVAYGESDFDTAEDLYAQAIELLESDPMAERVAYEPISLYRSMHALCLYKLDQIEDAKLQATKVVTRGDSQQYRWYPELVEFSDILLMRITDLSSDGKAASRELRSDSHTGSESGPQQCTTHEEDEVSKSALQEVTVSQSPVRCRSIERRLHDEEVLDGQVAGETISVRTLD